ncbi:FecR family protein [Methylotuvimicrobium buryatense]|uniref:FecR family protein n=1 Tax=Methylotuvimicrobium buryatense TaxID=95641 RepID=A0A4P9UKX0_METBY|nr:FecR family protein [Methylotuvimicrobium buryatense]QCW81140.1 FecR family protein [Methylotuvimicrobium buryatense]
MSKKPVSKIHALSDRALEWLILLHSGNATEWDRQNAHEWRARSPAHEKAFAEAERLWFDMGEALAGKPLETVKPRFSTAKLSGLAALFLLAAVLPFLGLHDYFFSDYRTGVGERRTIILADGSQVLLNTDTAIALNWNEQERSITLRRGQALFTVEPDPNRPFSVETDDCTVTALGTVFEVRTEREATRVTVLEHAVEIEPVLSGKPALRLEEGHQTRFGTAQGFEPVNAADIDQVKAWQRGKLIVKDRPLSEVVAELDRYYRGAMIVAGNHLPNLRVTGVFPTGDRDGVIAMIETALPVRVTRLTPWLTILHE